MRHVFQVSPKLVRICALMCSDKKSLKLGMIFTPLAEGANEDTRAADATKNTDAFAELVQCLDDRSLTLINRYAANDGRKAFGILREHYRSKGKPRIITLYTELTSLI